VVGHRIPGEESLQVSVYGLPRHSPSKVQALDGLFLAVNRSVLDSIRFDEGTFTGFHLYDLDFTYGAYLQGFRLGVCEDIAIIHASTGHFQSSSWQRYAASFLAKYRESLGTFQESSDGALPNFHFVVPDEAAFVRAVGLFCDPPRTRFTEIEIHDSE
jgi:GT2 family glycosyltransferase